MLWGRKEKSLGEMGPASSHKTPGIFGIKCEQNTNEVPERLKERCFFCVEVKAAVKTKVRTGATGEAEVIQDHTLYTHSPLVIFITTGKRLLSNKMFYNA